MNKYLVDHLDANVKPLSIKAILTDMKKYWAEIWISNAGAQLWRGPGGLDHCPFPQKDEIALFLPGVDPALKFFWGGAIYERKLWGLKVKWKVS